MKGRYNRIFQIFKKDKINFYGLQTAIQDYIANCLVCVQNKRTSHREDPITPISIDSPNIRYEFDVTYLNDDLEEAFDVKYWLSIIDVFRRKGMI